ncbi:hypothetical protein B0T16DRAFT_9189 [Cercophora newfieldiana]|uniref:Uncharacterized protein n=1 Tax=Cercophora newfieldiana TaxID=92897 RepID=A0AA39YPD2_9PEZI|nr:hypothetical protein B0T16DRAFT_9189 [Cercophora newfieldiana]
MVLNLGMRTSSMKNLNRLKKWYAFVAQDSCHQAWRSPSAEQRPAQQPQDPNHFLNAIDLTGRACYHAFDKTVELTTVVRQEGEAQRGFRDALEGLRNNNPTVAN